MAIDGIIENAQRGIVSGKYQGDHFVLLLRDRKEPQAYVSTAYSKRDEMAVALDKINGDGRLELVVLYDGVSPEGACRISEAINENPNALSLDYFLRALSD